MIGCHLFAITDTLGTFGTYTAVWTKLTAFWCPWRAKRVGHVSKYTACDDPPRSKSATKYPRLINFTKSIFFATSHRKEYHHNDNNNRGKNYRTHLYIFI